MERVKWQQNWCASPDVYLEDNIALNLHIKKRDTCTFSLSGVQYSCSTGIIPVADKGIYPEFICKVTRGDCGRNATNTGVTLNYSVFWAHI